MRMPISKWTEDLTKELVEQLLQDGKLIGIQKRKYKLITEKLSRMEEEEEDKAVTKLFRSI
jgi:hypothetical protein